jgi:hypothetical protein
MKHWVTAARQETEQPSGEDVDIPADALGFLVVMVTVLGSAFAVKILVWGKGPIKRLPHAPTDNEHLDAIEERVRQLEAMMTDRSLQLDELHERLDFAERILSKGREAEPTGIEPPPS